MDKQKFTNLKAGDRVELGSYPQDFVTDAEINAAINKIIGKPPRKAKAPWIDYGYTEGSGMYADTVYEGRRYRSIFIKKPTDDFWQEYSEYPKKQIYTFIYQPIAWRVMAIQDGKALLVSEKVIDFHTYFNGADERIIDGATVYANNYKHSSVRKWLNGEFLGFAFTEDERAVLEYVTVKNDASTTKKPVNKFACEDTVDRVFLLSFQEAKTLFPDNKARWKKATEYFKGQGHSAYKTPDAKHNNTCWCLRSPSHSYCRGIRGVGDGGGLGDGGFSTSDLSVCDGAIVPAVVVAADFQKQLTN